MDRTVCGVGCGGDRTAGDEFAGRPAVAPRDDRGHERLERQLVQPDADQRRLDQPGADRLAEARYRVGTNRLSSWQ